MNRALQGMGYQSQDFGSAQAQQYMSPYLQNVLDVQKNQAMLDFQRGQAGRDATAVGEGAFGGSRGAVQQGIANEALQRDMQRIQAEGQQKAFESAQQQFGADRDSRAQAEKMGIVCRRKPYPVNQLNLLH
jgi:surface antigen